MSEKVIFLLVLHCPFSILVPDFTVLLLIQLAGLFLDDYIGNVLILGGVVHHYTRGMFFHQVTGNS